MNDDNTNTDQTNETRASIPLIATFDPEKDSASEQLIAAIATINDADPRELEVLAHSIDPDALDTLMSRKNCSVQNGETQISFPYAGHRVHIQSDGTMTFRANGSED
ncbi:HalOD1 output domain-containing protein [Haladaptatus sp. DYSN1]|uniref:HalOD1 output domain-containing protein n=1 Tax=unclassified Haladaptatus TaxID=2622732 RepID=UPI0024058F80|nr:HalOD1 output domain-containing protein [Haladaptatus sp. DYSN1]